MLGEEQDTTKEDEVKETEASEEPEEEEESSEKEAEESDVDDSAKDKEDDDLAGYSESVQKRIRKLTAKTRELERRELEALEYAKAVKEDLENIKRREASMTKSFESEAEARLRIQEQLLKDQYKLAVDSGDVEKQVEAQSTMAQLAVERERLRNFKAYREQQAEQPVRQPPAQAAPPPQPDVKAQRWANKNTWFGADRAMTFTAYEIHNDLVSEGYDGSSDDYYRELDTRMRREFPSKFKEAVKKPAPAVASGRPTQVKKSNPTVELTDTQKNIARRLGVSYDDYIRQLKLTRERVD